MNRIGAIELSTSFVVKLIFGLVMILIIISLFADFIPFFSKQPFLGKLMLLMAIFVLYDNIVGILIKIGMA
ncbi:MAG: hypothetical protein GXP63_00905 [DPANN group archaeon]|nr:hypothetical protein [DPANN group archaeon]